MKTKKLIYKPTSPYVVYALIAKRQMESIDHFLELASSARKSKRQDLEIIAIKANGNFPNDWLVDDFAQLDIFFNLSAEFAIVGLWRCIELFRKRTFLFKFGKEAAAKAYRHDYFQQQLKSLCIDETQVSCSRSVDELRCLNNSIKHSLRVNDKLAQFSHWKNKRGNTLRNLESHYRRLRPFAERYLKDLSRRLARIKI